MYESGIRNAVDVSKGYAYPVLSRGGEPILLNTMENGSSIYIYTLSGQLVFRTTLPDYRSSVIWNLRNPISGKAVAPGIYLYKFIAPGKKSKTGKFAVVR